MEKSMETRLIELEQTVDGLKKSNETQEKFIESVEGLLAAFQALQGAWKVLEFIGKLAKPVAFIGAFAGSVMLFLGQRKS